MTDDRRRMLTEEVLGECWHGYTDGVTSDGQWRMCTCGYAYIIPEKHRNRTFLTWQDTGDLKKQIVEMGRWGEFMMVQKRQIHVTENPNGMTLSEWVDWLMDPIRFPELVVEWWKGRK